MMLKTNIPKKIHYCWFGGAPLPGFAKKCIASWKKYCPDYEIVQWTEKDIDIDSSKFMKDAYKNKKWAFVSDYARYKIIYENGGIYLDTDVEIIKNLDGLLENQAFMGFEGDEYVNSGLGFGACKNHPIIKDILDLYDKTKFNVNKLNEIATPVLVTSLLDKKGLVRNGETQNIDSMVLLSQDYLCPKNPITRMTNINSNTVSIHHYDASWVDNKEKKLISVIDKKGRDLMKEYPDLISIIIPVYNGEDYVRVAIDSALNQTYRNIEVIVVNDGSIDKTDEIVRSYGSRVRYFKKDNGGVASALNLAISKMRGKYFSWLSHDDVYHKDKLKILHEALVGESKTIAISDWSIIDENGEFIRKTRLDDRLASNPKAFLAFDRKTWLNACAMLIPKDLFDSVGVFNEKLRTTQDYDMLNRLIDSGVGFKIVHKPLLLSRHHSKQGSLAYGDALENSDEIHKEIISGLGGDSFSGYFSGDTKEVIKVYKSFLDNGYKQTPAHIISCTMDMVSRQKDEELTKKTLKRFGISFDDSSSINKKLTYKKKKRLMFCMGYWLTGGMERVLSNIFDYLSDEYDIFLITTFDGRESSIKIPKGVTRIKLSQESYEHGFDVLAFSLALSLKIDVLIGVFNLFRGQISLYDLCHKAGIKTVASNHEQYFYAYKSHHIVDGDIISDRLRVFSEVDVVFWLNKFSLASYGLSHDNGYLMPNPNTFKVLSSGLKNSNTKNIICVGRFNDYIKRIDRILECFSLVLDRLPDAKLTIVGNCDANVPIYHLNNLSINQIIDSFKINRKSINFVGEVSDMAKYYSQSDLLLMASLSEGFPMVINEAACFGVPVVCSRIPGLEDIVKDGDNGYLVDQGDIKSMSDKVYDILSNDKLSLKMRQKAIEMVQSFRVEIIGSKWKKILGSLIKDNGSKERLIREDNSSNAINYKLLAKTILNEVEEIYNIKSFAYQPDNNINNQSDANFVSMGRRILIITNKFKGLCKGFKFSLQEKGVKRTALVVLKKIKNRIF